MSVIGTWVAILCARVQCDVAGETSVPRAAKALIRIPARVVLTHGTIRAGLFHTFGLLFLTLQAAIAVRAVAAVPLRQVNTGAAIVARFRSALVHVNLTEPAGETCRAVALYLVLPCQTHSSILTGAVRAGDGLTVALRG